MSTGRRDFLKKTGLLSAAGFLPPNFSLLYTLAASSPDSNSRSSSFFIKNAEIISMDEKIGDLPKASILVYDGEIIALNKDLSPPEGVEVIDGSEAIVMPGLIDCHWHLWTSPLRSMAGSTQEQGYFPMTTRYSREYSPEDMKIAAEYAAAEALNAGITTISDFNHNARTPEYIMASCNALAEAGLRAEVLYGGYRDQKENEPTDFEGINRVLDQIQEDEKYRLLKLGLGSRGVDYRNLERTGKKQGTWG